MCQICAMYILKDVKNIGGLEKHYKLTQAYFSIEKNPTS